MYFCGCVGQWRPGPRVLWLLYAISAKLLIWVGRKGRVHTGEYTGNNSLGIHITPFILWHCDPVLRVAALE